MKKLVILLFCLSCFILKSCEKDEEEISCKISFALTDGQIKASGCSNVTISNIKYSLMGQPMSFNYSGCSETGNCIIVPGEEYGTGVVYCTCN